MATSPSRRNRRNRRRKASVIAAVGASAALLAGGLTAPPAGAFALEDVNLPPVIAACNAGTGEAPSEWPVSADCSDASAALLATIGDAIVGIILPDFPLTLSGLNGALATPGAHADISWGGIDLIIPGNAAISGSGYTTALVILGGDAQASADYILAAAVALASNGGSASASSLFGASVATAIGRPGAQVLGVGVPPIANTATSNALPFGIAIANSANSLFANPANNDAERHAAATALGGIAAAYSALDATEGAVCTALYATASLKDKDGGNVSSCTSIFFIFQQSQQGDDPVVYAIKNPFDINLVSPYGDGFADLISAGLGLLPGLAGIEIPDEVLDLIAGKFVPEFGSDIIRISFDGGTPQIGTDLPDWIAGLSAPTATTADDAGDSTSGDLGGTHTTVVEVGVGGGGGGAGGDSGGAEGVVVGDGGGGGTGQLGESGSDTSVVGGGAEGVVVGGGGGTGQLGESDSGTSVVGGGGSNEGSGTDSVIGGGSSSEGSGTGSVVGGGGNNEGSGTDSVVVGADESDGDVDLG